MHTFISFLENKCRGHCVIYIDWVEQLANFQKTARGTCQCKLPHCWANVVIYWAYHAIALCELRSTQIKQCRTMPFLIENLFRYLLLLGLIKAQRCRRIECFILVKIFNLPESSTKPSEGKTTLWNNCCRLNVKLNYVWVS